MADINPKRLQDTIKALKARFETDAIASMNDLTTTYVTGMTAVLGMGYDRFIKKCASPEKFTIEELKQLAYVLDVKFELIMKVVEKQAHKTFKPRDISHLLPKS